MRWEVQQWTLCQGWVNGWLVGNGDDAEPLELETFATYEEALAELESHIADTEEMVRAGDRDEPDSVEEYRIVEVA